MKILLSNNLVAKIIIIIIITSRCPTLREIIEQFWAEGGGGLELSIDASAETLSYVCKYLHEGTLYCSDSMHQLLEMARVSAELGMLGLHKMTIDSISARINRDNVHEIMGFGESHAYHELIRCCKNFLLTGRAVAVKYTTSSDPTGSNLHKAIFDSLQDVSEVLKQTPSVFPNFSHQKQLETVDNSKTSIIEVDEIVENVHYMSAMNNNANNYTGSKRTVTKGKPRSGEIYRLLLQDSQTAEAIEYNDGASIIDQFANPSIVAKQKSAGTIPGKLMKDTTRSSSQRQVAAKTRSGSNSSAPASISKGGKSLIKNGQTNKDRNEFKKVSSQINTATTKLVEYNTAMSLDPAASQEFNSR